MSLHRFFLDSQVLACQDDDTFRLELSKEDEKHAKVARLEVGEHIAVIDGDSDYFECVVERFDADGLFVSISQHLDAPKESFEVVLYQGLAKGERFDFVLKHATELGVSAFVPLMSSRTVVKIDEKKLPSKMDRWRSIVKNAAKQSGLVFIPSVELPVDIDACAKELSSFDLVLICWEEAFSSVGIRRAIEDAQLPAECKVAIIVGPEGGLSEGEVSTLLDSCARAKLVSLGPTILRTETAGIVSCALALDALREGYSR